MSDEKSSPEKPPEPLSRRDFLRRAGKEAAQTGSQILPGGQVVTAVIGTDTKPSVWERMARWRKGRNDGQNETKADDGTDNREPTSGR